MFFLPCDAPLGRSTINKAQGGFAPGLFLAIKIVACFALVAVFRLAKHVEHVPLVGYAGQGRAMIDNFLRKSMLDHCFQSYHNNITANDRTREEH